MVVRQDFKKPTAGTEVTCKVLHELQAPMTLYDFRVPGLILSGNSGTAPFRHHVLPGGQKNIRYDEYEGKPSNAAVLRN